MRYVTVPNTPVILMLCQNLQMETEQKGAMRSPKD